MKLQAIDAGVPESLIMLDETSETYQRKRFKFYKIYLKIIK